MQELDRLYFRKYAIDPESELDESDIYNDAWLSQTLKENAEQNQSIWNDWFDIE